MCRGSLSNLSLAALAAGLLCASACKPTYPKCESDEHCQEKGEVCVNGQCQECRDESQCLAKYPNEKRECNDGRCDIKPECRTDPDCATLGAGLVCRTNKCVPECAQDADCGAAKKCVSQKCVAECSVDIDCGPGRTCSNGQCQDADANATRVSANCRPMNPASGDVIALDAVRFEFNQYDLTGEARDTLNRAIECLKQAPGNLKIVAEGHCDDRGTQEYNLALGERRAQAVTKYLKTMGIDTKRFSVRSKGENEPLCHDQTEDCWARNRRVQFIQKLGAQ
ncbi:MAG TPA: OmpA family protein [Myxococcota bacterium]|nr:OmpA family protein [Myxococcota bacterium]